LFITGKLGSIGEVLSDPREDRFIVALHIIGGAIHGADDDPRVSLPAAIAGEYAVDDLCYFGSQLQQGSSRHSAPGLAQSMQLVGCRGTDALDTGDLPLGIHPVRAEQAKDVDQVGR